MMAEAKEDNEDDAKEFGDVRRARAPSKKKFDEEMEALCTNIRKTEEQLEALKSSISSDALKNLKAEKNANIERRKTIDADLQRLNKDISEMMHNISRLESTLHYRNEDKIDEAIRRLEWNLKVQNFKLSQEKKIVAEIDSLRRSKKPLMQYLSLKKEKDAMRDRQRRMREERDYYFHKVSQLKQKEEKLRSETSAQKAKAEQLKKKLDTLYEAKRQMVSVFKKQRDDFNDGREKRRHESFKKRIEEKQAIQAALRQEIEEFEAQKQPYEDDICLCNTLIHYLQRFVSNTDLDSSYPGVTVTPAALSSPSEESPPSVPGPAEELEDGQFVLLRKNEDDNYVTCSAKHAARKQRRSRKQSMVKRITHTPEVLAQFLQLNLNAPTTVAEILVSLEQLQARKLHYEREAEVKSEAELSVTESTLYETSRQASRTESSDGLTETRPSEQVIEQLLQLSVTDDPCLQGHDHDPKGRFPDDCQGPGKADHADDDVASFLEQSYLQSVDPSDDFPAPLRSTDLDSTHSQSGSDSTPRSSSTVEGACGGVENGHSHSLREDPEPESVGHEVRCSNSSADALCDTGGEVFYAKPGFPDSDAAAAAAAVSSGSDSVLPGNSPAKIPTPSAGAEDRARELGSPHICCAQSSTSKTSPAALPKIWNSCDNKNVLSSSLLDFPALVSGKRNDAPLMLPGDLVGAETHRQEKSTVTDSTWL